jgi:hypothetical protein
MICLFRHSVFAATARVATLACLALGILAVGASAAEPVALRSAKPDGTPIHVAAVLEVGGYLKLPTDKTAKDPDVPMSAVAQFNYDEVRLDDGADADHRLALRSYDDSQATIKIASKTTKPQLRESRKLIAAAATKDNVTLSSPGGPLTRDELELIDIPANTLTLDQLLPQADVQLGHRWKPAEDVMARFLCLDAVGHTEVECVLVDAKDSVAEITIDGALGGALDGIATEIELKGKLIFDTGRGAAKSLLLAIKEKRGVSYVDPGVDVVAKLKLTVTPLTESKSLSSDVVQQAKLPDTGAEPPLEYVSEAKGYRFAYDRRWHVIREEPGLVVLRFVDRGELVAQCNVSPSADPIAKPPELSEFQTQVQDALGKLFGHFERAIQRGTDSGLRVLESIADGTAQDLAIQWRYYLVHDRAGRAVTIVFTMEAPQSDRFADQDTPIIDSVQFVEPKVAGSKPSSRRR